MRLALGFAALSIALLHAAAPPAASGAPLAEPLSLNEIMAGPSRDWDGSGTFSARDDEWIEVKNAGTTALDLSAYLLTDGDSLPRYALSGTLGSQQRLVVFGRDSYDWERAHGFPAFGLSLGNSGDAVLLWKVAAGETLLIDSYTYRSHEAAADRAVGRLGDTGAWELFDGLNPYTGSTLPHGNGCDPTPGAANLCGLTPTRPSTWGRLKAIYR